VKLGYLLSDLMKFAQEMEGSRFCFSLVSACWTWELVEEQVLRRPHLSAGCSSLAAEVEALASF
jgi:hypothetical protein